MTGRARLDAQFAFLAEADRLKSVVRGTTLHDASRRENSAEHSWHVMLYAFTLAEHADRRVDTARVLLMLLLHDLVEIDAGDAPIHADHDAEAQARRERAAADRIFGLLPPDQASRYRALWDEFEAGETGDAVFARSIDRVQPVVSNLESGGASWTDYDVTRDQLETRVAGKVRRGAVRLWDHLVPRIDTWFAGRG